MRRGCISLGEVRCDGCHQTIPYPERYLVVDEADDVGAEGGKVSRYCVKCSLDKGYAHYKIEKGKLVLTFFEE